jgi:hypothetical protein
MYGGRLFNEGTHTLSHSLYIPHTNQVCNQVEHRELC